MIKLSKDILFKAIIKSINNSAQLIEEGKILKDNNRFARAYCLFQFAIEEVGKANMTFKFLLFDDYEDANNQKIFLARFKNHRVKIKESIEIDNFLIMIPMKNSLRKTLKLNIKKQSNSIQKFDELKNLSLYTFLIENECLLPAEIISEELVNDIEFYADCRQKLAKELFDILIKDFDKIRNKIAD